MACKRPTKKMSQRHLLWCLSGKRKPLREENAEKCRQFECSLINASGLRKLPSGSGDWRTLDELNLSWCREGRWRIPQTRFQVLWRSLRGKREPCLAVGALEGAFHRLTLRKIVAVCIPIVWVNKKRLMTGPQETMSFVCPKPWPGGTLTSRGNKTHCFPRRQSLSALLYLPTQKQKKMPRIRLLYNNTTWLKG